MMKSFFSMHCFNQDVVVQTGPEARAAQQRNTRISKGFTLIELMIVVAIVAILTAIAYPSYTRYIIKTRRTAAKACLSEYANYMERYYTTNLAYDKSNATPAVPNGDPGLDCEQTQQTGNYYTWGNPTNLNAGTYTLSAAPKGAQKDTECGTLSLDQTGKRDATGTLRAAGCW